MEYIYNSCFIVFVDCNIRVIDFHLTKDDIVLPFVCLAIFDWMPDIFYFMLLGVLFCCFHLLLGFV